MTSKTLSKAVILDRDGTLHRDTGYLIDFAGFEPLPGVEEALRLLQAKGYRLFVATNQSGVARGMFSLQRVEALNARIAAYFRERGAILEDFAVCPHHPEGTVPEYARACDCRKPAPGLILDLIRKHDLDPARSYMVGDSLRDVEAGRAAGVKVAWISGQNDKKERDSALEFPKFDNLLEFASSI